MKEGIGGVVLLALVACAPMKDAYLPPRTSIIDVQARAKRLETGGWEICLSLPSTAAAWSVSIGEPYDVIRQDEGGRAKFSWIIPPERWRSAEPFRPHVKASGIDEVVTIPHPTRETVIATGVEVLLDILFLPSKIPHGVR